MKRILLFWLVIAQALTAQTTGVNEATQAQVTAGVVGQGYYVSPRRLAGAPVSPATQAALDLKAPIASPTFTGTVTGNGSGLTNVNALTLQTYTPATLPLSTAQAESVAPWSDTSKYVFGSEYLHHWKTLLLNQSASPSTVVAAFAGDSTTEGANITYAGSLVQNAFAASYLQKFPSISSLNRGHSGASTQAWLNTYLAADLALSPKIDLYVVRYGLNDAPDVATYISRIRTGLTTLRSTTGFDVANCSVILVSPSTSDEGARTPAWHEAIDAGLRIAARDFQCAYIDAYSLAKDSNGASLWLDSIKLHPADSLASVINSAIIDLCIPRSMEAFSITQAKNLGSIYGTPTVANPPSAYAADFDSKYRATTGQGWPFEGAFITQRQADNYFLQINYGVSGGFAVRTNVDTSTWNPWVVFSQAALTFPGGATLAAGAGDADITLSPSGTGKTQILSGGIDLAGAGLASAPTIGYGLFPHATVGLGLKSENYGISFWGPSAEFARFAPGSGRLLLGTSTDDGVNLLQVNGSMKVLSGIDGNASTATALATACTINGVSFNGTADITITESVQSTSPTTGQTVTVSAVKTSSMNYITPAGTLASLTLTLPSSANAQPGMICRFFITQIITSLTVNTTGGGSIIGTSPDTSAVNSSFAYQCVSTSGAGTWVMIYPQ